MRRRLMIAILALTAGALVLAGAGGFVLIRRASVSTAEQQLYSEAKVIATLTETAPNPKHPLNPTKLLPVLRYVGDYQRLGVAGLSGADDFTTGLPAALEGVPLRPSALLSGSAIAGSVEGQVYVLIPLTLSTAEKQSLKPSIPYQDEAVLVAMRTVRYPVSGVWYFLLVGLAVLAVAGAVAYWLANRFSRPLVIAAQATARIAGGDLESRMPVDPGDMPEFALLSTAINSMGDSLERARQQQRQFLLSISHDLRTPLTSIRGYAEAIADGTAGDVAAASRIINDEASRLERLVQDLLDLARLDARRFSLHVQPLEAEAVVARTVESFTPGASAIGVAITAALPSSPVEVVADPDRLGQLLSNLVENAFKFARSKVEVGVRSEGAIVTFWVTDDGGGISASDLAHVFEPHFTSDRTGARRSGTGLGLAIVAELASAMGGGVQAESPAPAPAPALALAVAVEVAVEAESNPADGRSAGGAPAAPGPAAGTDSGSGPGTRMTVWLPTR